MKFEISGRRISLFLFLLVGLWCFLWYLYHSHTETQVPIQVNPIQISPSDAIHSNVGIYSKADHKKSLTDYEKFLDEHEKSLTDHGKFLDEHAQFLWDDGCYWGAFASLFGGANNIAEAKMLALKFSKTAATNIYWTNENGFLRCRFLK